MKRKKILAALLAGVLSFGTFLPSVSAQASGAEIPAEGDLEISAEYEGEFAEETNEQIQETDEPGAGDAGEDGEANEIGEANETGEIGVSEADSGASETGEAPEIFLEETGSEDPEEISVLGSAGHTTIATAQSIATNKSVTDNLATSSTKNWYKFTLEQDGYISLTFSHSYIDSQYIYWHLYLYDDDENAIVDLDYTGNEKNARTTVNYGLGKGTYYIRISSGAFSDTSYTLSVNYTASSVWEKEFNDTIVTANSIGPNTEMHGNLRTSSDKDFYAFTVSETGYVSLTFSPVYIDEGWNYWYCSLYDDDENRIVDLSYPGRTQTTTSDRYLLGRGTYYLRITSGSHSESNYSFKVNYTTTETMYRLYNPNSGEHFYTADAGERSALISFGWKDEGVAWTAPVSSNTPVYRLYNPNAGDHHYTPDLGERNALMNLGWKYEGIGWYSSDAHSVPLYRLYNPNATGAGAHHYTTDAAERSALIGFGWRDEGIGWYGR